MQTGTMSVKALMLQISQGQLRLPEIQRAYVWKPAQIAGLVDSLYRRYPSGSLLLWKTTEEVVDRSLATAEPSAPGFNAPTYLLDGQQRLTSLHRVYTGHDRADIVFQPIEERFQVASAATRRDSRWVSVHGLLTGALETFTLAQEIAEANPDRTPQQVFERLERVRKVDDYLYWLEILDDLPYEEVTQIFVRVNSRGRALKDTDLALATLSARWPGAMARVDEQVDWCASHGYDGLGPAFIVRCLAALAVDTTSPGGFANVSIEQLERSWGQLERGLHHTVNLLHDGVGIDDSRLIPSDNALVPLVYWLGTRPDTPLGDEERKTLVYWLLVTFMESRYGASARGVIAQDVGALRTSDEPLQALYRNLGLLDARPTVTPERLAGKGSRSPFFLFSYLVARRRNAGDWWYGLPVRLSHDGSYKVEYHHIHPRTTLKERYSKAEINDLANLAFISDRANRKIGGRSPADYMAAEDFNLADLPAHLVPTDPDLRTAESFPQFVTARRQLLADAMNDLLDSYRPAFLTSETEPVETGSPSRLSLQAFGSAAEPDSIRLVYDAVAGDRQSTGWLWLSELTSALAELADGRGGEISVDGQAIAIEQGEELTLALGPLLVRGSLAEWQDVTDRERSDVADDSAQHTDGEAFPPDQLIPFEVRDSD